MRGESDNIACRLQLIYVVQESGFGCFLPVHILLAALQRLILDQICILARWSPCQAANKNYGSWILPSGKSISQTSHRIRYYGFKFAFQTLQDYIKGLIYADSIISLAEKHTGNSKWQDRWPPYLSKEQFLFCWGDTTNVYFILHGEGRLCWKKPLTTANLQIPGQIANALFAQGHYEAASTICRLARKIHFAMRMNSSNLPTNNPIWIMLEFTADKYVGQCKDIL
jgi:hypothetical protein